MKHYRKNEVGAVDSWMIATIGLIVGVVAFGALAIWAFLNYQEAQTGVDAKIDAAVATAEKKQADEDERKFAEREKNPRREFAGPDDYGRLAFTYPKTWSAYVDSDGTSGSTYEAYLHPVVVPSIKSSTEQFALRVTIEQKSYDNTIKSYESLVKKGDLKSSSVNINGDPATRLDGAFSKDIRGAAVVFKLRDKTVTLQTDADTFKPDFDEIIKTITYNS